MIKKLRKRREGLERQAARKQRRRERLRKIAAWARKRKFERLAGVAHHQED